MSDETITVQMVPMADQDKDSLKQAINYLYCLGTLLGDDWEGWGTIKGLNRLADRVREYGFTYEIPLPIGMRTKEPLFIPEEEVRG